MIASFLDEKVGTAVVRPKGLTVRTKGPTRIETKLDVQVDPDALVPDSAVITGGSPKLVDKLATGVDAPRPTRSMTPWIVGTVAVVGLGLVVAWRILRKPRG